MAIGKLWLQRVTCATRIEQVVQDDVHFQFDDVGIYYVICHFFIPPPVQLILD